MTDVTAYRSSVDRIMQAPTVVEETLCILMSAAEECRRNAAIPIACLGIIQAVLLKETERYLQRMWPTLKKVCGHAE